MDRIGNADRVGDHAGNRRYHFYLRALGRLPEKQRDLARELGLALAMIARLGLLFSISSVMRLSHPRITVLGQEISGREFILIGRGLFLIGESNT